MVSNPPTRPANVNPRVLAVRPMAAIGRLIGGNGSGLLPFEPRPRPHRESGGKCGQHKRQRDGAGGTDAAPGHPSGKNEQGPTATPAFLASSAF